jgi:protocatechuate 3,4-dioxygenase beta subunit
VAIACVVVLAARRGPAWHAPSPAESAAPVHAPRSSAPIAVAARPRASIAGRVVDGDGKPIASAQVCAWASAGHGLVTNETEVPRCATADREGAYAMGDLFPAVPLSISASATGFAPAAYRTASGEHEVRLGDGERRAGVNFVLKPGVALKGSVNDLTGGGIVGALVVGESGADRAVTTSGAKGEFTLWVEAGQVLVKAAASGYAPGMTGGSAPEHFFKIDLVPGATLVGRAVIAGEETPVAGVFIEGIGVEGSWERSSTKTDEEGRFRIEGLSPGRYRVEATSEGREGYSRSSITLAMGETSSEVLIELDPAFVVRGRVVDKATGAPCTSGTVMITDGKQSEFSQAPIEPDGWARMASVIPGTYRVEVTCKGHVKGEDYPLVAVKDRDLAPLTWPVDKGASIRVEVVDAEGHTPKNVSVTAIMEASWGQSEHVEADGAFLVEGLKPGRYNVMAQTADGARADQPADASTGKEERIRIELPASGAIEGVVEDDAHRRVPNVHVRAFGPRNGWARSLDDGTFSIKNLAPGDYEVGTKDAPGRRRQQGPDDPRAVKVTVVAQGHAKVRITVEARSGVIQGRVVDASDRPVTDAFVEANPTAEGRYSSFSEGQRIMTDTDGRFTVDGLPDGEFNVRAFRAGGVEATLEHVKVGARDVTIRLGAGGSVAGILKAGNTPVERFTLSLRDTTAGFSRSELFFHAGGQFAVQDLPAGTYTIDAEAEGGSATGSVTLADGEQKKDVVLTITLRGGVSGRLVMLEGGAPVAGATLGVTGDSKMAILAGDGRDHKSKADGSFHLDSVLPGTWTLMVYPDQTAEPVRVPVTVPEGGGTIDLGAIRVPRRRVEPGRPRGNLGVIVTDGSGSDCVVDIAFGPAAEAGIVVGDVVVSIDGYDVTSNNHYLCMPLATAAPGRTVTFGLARGATVSVVAR